MESRQTTGGRLRSSFYDMHLRVPFLEGRMFGLDQVTNIPLAYPGGTAAYLYGSSLIRYIEDRYGPEKIREISHRTGDTCFPGGINRVARQPWVAATRACSASGCSTTGSAPSPIATCWRSRTPRAAR